MGLLREVAPPRLAAGTELARYRDAGVPLAAMEQEHVDRPEGLAALQENCIGIVPGERPIEAELGCRGIRDRDQYASTW